MTREDIIRMAKEAGMIKRFGDVHPIVERFAELVAQHEREECAKVCEKEIERIKPIYSVTAENALKAIKARSKE